MIKNLLSKSHNIKQYNSAGMTTIELNNNIIGRMNLEDIVHAENIIIAKNQVINKQHIAKLKKIGLLSIKVYSEQLGEICFVNKNY